MWFFKDRERGEIIDSLRSGDELQLTEEPDSKKLYFCVRYNGVVRRVACPSNRFIEELNRQKGKGYVPVFAKVSYVVKWRDKEDGQEYSILLPVIRLKKKI